MIAVDTNVLVFAHRSETELHDIALARLRELAEGETPWAIPVFVLGEFLRVVTHPVILIPPTSRAVATQALGAVVSAPTCRVLNPLDGFWTQFETVVSEAKVDGNALFDAQIVAVCRQHGVDEILTEDRGFRRFNGIRQVGLVGAA
ncbi:type II toxin-antitoxin system VapC family toxin [soil metagenome]